MSTNNGAAVLTARQRASDPEAADTCFPEGFDYLFAPDELHELFFEIVKLDIGNVLSNIEAADTAPTQTDHKDSKFTPPDRVMLRRIVEYQWASSRSTLQSLKAVPTFNPPL
jgi:hypothetical protein